MRTLTATLEAAQRANSQAPAVRVEIRDKQPRWRQWSLQQAYDVQMACCAYGSGIAVAILDADGDIWFKLVAYGGSWQEWPGTYTEVFTSALVWPHGDVAISNNSGTLRIFFILHDGTQVQCIESTDGGATWGAAVSVKSLVSSAATDYFKLASAGQNDVFWARDKSGYRYVYYRKFEGGAWGSEVPLLTLCETGGEYGHCGGLGAFYSASAGYIGLAAAFWGVLVDDGRVVFAHVNATNGAVISRARIAPPGYAPVGFTPMWPSVSRCTSLFGASWVVSYVDKFASVTTSWANRVAILSRDGDHWSYKVPLDVDTTYERRLNLVEGGGYMFAAHCLQVHYLLGWTAGDVLRNHTIESELRGYVMDERPDRGSLVVEVDNSDGRYDVGGAGGTAPECAIFAQVSANPGLTTSSGAERVEARPFLLWAVTRLRSAGRNRARLYCVDGWELFRIWRPDAVYVFEGKTVRWCIEELAARVGFWEVSFDASAAWSQTVAYLAVAGEATDWKGNQLVRAWGRWLTLHDPAMAFDDRVDGYTALQGILALVGGQARWGNGADVDHLYCFVPGAAGEDAADYSYAAGEVLETEVVDSFVWPTRVRAMGDGVSYEAESVAAGQAAGMEILGLLSATTWTTEAECKVAADASMQDAAARQKAGGRLLVRPNLGLELWDVVAVTDARVGDGSGVGSLAAATYRLNGIRTEWDAGKAKWEQQLRLEGV